MPRPALANGPERIKMARAVEIAGESERTLQAAAARGDIPGACKPFKCWTFDEAKLRAWIASKERKPCRNDPNEAEERGQRQRTRTSAAGSTGRGSRWAAGSSEAAYQRAMNALLGKEPKSGASAK
jgi:hypothetical protein